MLSVLIIFYLAHVGSVGLDSRLAQALVGVAWDTTAIRRDEPVAVYARKSTSLEPGDTLMVSCDMRTYVPCKVAKVVQGEMHRSYVLQDAPWSIICIGGPEYCLSGYDCRDEPSLESCLTSKVADLFWVYLRDSHIDHHQDTLEIRTVSDTFDLCTILFPPLIQRLRLVQLMDGRIAHLRYGHEKISFDSVDLSSGDTIVTTNEYFSLYRRPGTPPTIGGSEAHFDLVGSERIGDSTERRIYLYRRDSSMTYVQIHEYDRNARPLSIQHALVKKGAVVSGSLERLTVPKKVYHPLPERDVLRYVRNYELPKR